MDLGTHIPKSKLFHTSIKNFYETNAKTKPIQLFSGSPKFWRRPRLTREDVRLTKAFITANKLKVFTHSIYLINLCRPTFAEKAFNCLKWELQAGLLMGFSGVVVHCGKSLKMDINEALQNMYENIISVLRHTSPTCPLLLETSSGQGSETLWEFEAFDAFYNRFSREQQQLIKICIDTCHVFAAGHDPLKFLQNWEKLHPNTLVLIHFNDSKEVCGQKKDRHAFPGDGHIGAEKMCVIEAWARDRNIPMVLE